MTRVVRLLVVGVLLAAGFVLVPRPAVVWASELETRTIPVDLEPVPEPEVRASAAEVEATAHPSHDDDDAATHDHHHDGATLGREATGLDPFTAVGVTTSRQSDTPVRIRLAEDGSWGGWHELVHVEDHSPDGDEDAAERPGFTTEPLFVGEADGYQLQVPDDAGEVSLHLVTEVERARQIVDATAQAEGAPTIRSRSSWGARPPDTAPADAGELELAVIHHSVTSNAYSQAQVPTILRSIQAYHMDANGWNDIAYNFAVDRYGTIWEGRAGGIDRAIIGGHAYGFNTASTGVLVLGDYSATTPTGSSLNAVEDLLAWKLAEHQVPTTGTVTYRSATDTHFGPEGTPVRVNRISGHRDVRVTGCPGGALYSRLGSIRDGVAAKTPSAQTSATAAVIEGDRTGDGRDDLFLYRPGGGSDLSLVGTGGGRGLLGGPSPPGFVHHAARVTGRYEPHAGDFNGDGRSDIFWYAPGPSADHIWYGQADGGHRSVLTAVSGDYEPHVGDFDGDGRDDIFWYGPYGGADSVWYGRSDGFEHRHHLVRGGYEVHLGDFDGDGRDDIFWYGPGAARGDSVWYGRPDGSFDSVGATIDGYYRIQVGDFTGDGRDDLFLYRPGGRADFLLPAEGSREFGLVQRNISGHYDPVVGDFDGNGYDDILWNAEQGNDYLWVHGSGGFASHAMQLDASHRTVALDADGDGDDEIFSLDGTASGQLWDKDGGGFRSYTVP